jgi:hypothetical protein
MKSHLRDLSDRIFHSTEHFPQLPVGSGVEGAYFLPYEKSLDYPCCHLGGWCRRWLHFRKRLQHERSEPRG